MAPLTIEQMIKNFIKSNGGSAQGFEIRKIFSSTANSKSHKGWDMTKVLKPMVARGELVSTKRHAKQITYWLPESYAS
jgi:hypothetical protein